MRNNSLARRWVVLGVLALVLGVGALTQQAVSAQEPTPTPTPILVELDSGAFVVQQVITFGDVGVVVALLLVAGLLLIRLGFEVVAWLRQ